MKIILDRSLSIILFIIVFISLLGIPVQAINDLTWEKVVSTHIDSLNNVTYGNGVFVAVGDDGVIVNSKDGIKWSNVKSGTCDHLQKIVFNRTCFVAIGTRSITYSKDGVNWTLIKIFDGEYSFDNLIWTGKKFIITGSKDVFSTVGKTQVLSSLDGKCWNEETVLNKCTMMDVIWKNNKAYAVVINGPNEYVATSSDFINWKFTNIGMMNYHFKIVYNGKAFFIYSYSGTDKIIKSIDGSKWDCLQSKGANSYNDVIWDGKEFISVNGDSNSIKTSKDGTTWTTIASVENASKLNSIIYSNGKYIVVGEYGSICVSQNLTSWTTVSPKEEFCVYDIKWDGKMFIAVGSHGLIMTSIDGTEWKRRDSKTQENIFSITCGDKKYIAKCESGTLLISYDLDKWNKLENDILFCLMAWNGENYVAIGKNSTDMKTNYIYTSRDGITWVKTDTTITEDFYNMTWDSKEFIIYGYSNIYTSIDGITWNYKKVGISFDSLAFSGKSYIATNFYTGEIYKSENLIDWNVISKVQKIRLNSVKYINNQFFILGSTGTIMSSADGGNWVTYRPRTNYELYGIDFGNNTYVAAGVQIMVSKES